MIQPLIRVRLERIGLDPSDHRFMELARARLSPLAWTVLVGEPLKWPPWYRTLRSDTRRTVAIVHRILDQMDDLTPARWHRAGPVTQYWTGDEQIDDTSRVAAARPSR